MAHKMGLAQFTLADKDIFTSKKYLDKSGSTYSYVWVEDSTLLKAHSSRTFSTNPKPYSHNTATKYYIVKKATNTTFTAADENQYPNGDVPNNGWSEPNVNIAGGQCKIVTRTPAITCSVFSQHTLQVGDIMYTDGALSSTHTGSLHKSPVGIVFFVNTNLMPMSSYDVNLGYTHGYVMALKDCDKRSSSQWGSGAANTDIVTDETINSSEEVTQIAALQNDYNGLKHCDYALEGSYASLCTAINKAKAHIPAMPISGTIRTSGWYLPSSGHLYRWLTAFSDGWITDDIVPVWRSSYNDYYYKAADDDGTTEKSLTTRVRLAMNKYLTDKGLTAGTDFDAFTAGNYFWSSTERIGTTAICFYFYEGGRSVWPNCGNSSAEPKSMSSGRNFTKAVLAF